MKAILAFLIFLATVLGLQRLVDRKLMSALQIPKRRQLRRIFAVVASMLLMTGLLLKTNPALAFKPNQQGHLGITTESIIGNRLLPLTSRTINGVRYTFSGNAITAIGRANAATDNLLLGEQGFWISENHFDNEGFVASSTRLIRLKNSIISKIISPSPDGAGARNDLGGALHTIQDYYAHSNWVELNAGNIAPLIDPRLGRSVIPNPSPSIPTSPFNDPGTLLPGLTQLTSGYFTFPFLCSAPAGKTRHGVAELPYLCPTGLNKDDPNRRGYDRARYLAVLASRDFIEQILNARGVAGNARAIRALMRA